MTIKIAIRNSFCRLVSCHDTARGLICDTLTYDNQELIQEEQYLLEQLKFAHMIKNRVKNRQAHNQKTWGMKQRLKYVQENITVCWLLDGQEFPTGLLPLIEDTLKHANFDYELIDKRKKPEKVFDFEWVGESKEDRHYQAEMIKLGVENHRGVFESAVGSGKTFIIQRLVQELGVRSLIIAPAVDLAHQLYADFAEAFGRKMVGFVESASKAKEKEVSKPILITTIHTLKSWKKNEFLTDFTKDFKFLYLDECFPYRTYVRTDKGNVCIGTLFNMWKDKKALPLIKSFNIRTNEFEYKKITYAWEHTGTKQLVELQSSKKRIKCTKNHRFLVIDKSWKSAQSLVVGDIILGDFIDSEYNFQPQKVSDHQFQLILGSFFGDGHIDTLGSGKMRLSMTHGKKQKEYLLWKSSIFTGKFAEVSGNGYSKGVGYRFSTTTFNLMEMFSASKTTISEDVLRKLSPLGLAIWYTDDGSYSKKNKSASLHTECFDYQSHIRIQAYFLKVWDMKVNIHKCPKEGKEYYRIYIPVASFWIFKSIIEDYIHPTMAYKLGNCDITVPYQLKVNGCPLGTFKITKVRYLNSNIHTEKRLNNLYDLEIEDNHNFVVSASDIPQGVIAHNCHHQASETYTNMLDDIDHIYYRFAGSGTFMRNDSKTMDLHSVLSDVLYRYSGKQAVEDGFLVPVELMVHPIKGQKAQKYQTEYTKNYSKNAAFWKKILEVIILIPQTEQILILVDRKDTVGKIIHEFLESHAISTTYVSGDDKKDVVKAAIADFNSKDIRILIGSTILGEGINIKSTDHLLMARGGKSEIAITQAIGRLIRLFKGKTVGHLHEFHFIGTKYLEDHLIQRIKIYEKNFKVK
ncbi:MAG: hypothetical protein DRP08_03385 [Candidatus Aenigmatarchaeota archaeon]|nr:MAG: hypothetical protein DRP08_03385 [Candidatus Aenigmarchaeota archaeon]